MQLEYQNSVLYGAKVWKRDALNTSTHDPILAEILIHDVSAQSLDNSRPYSGSNRNQVKPKINWSKLDIDKYRDLTAQRVPPILKKLQDNPDDVNLDGFIEQLNAMLNDTAVGVANARKKSHGTHHSSHMPQELKKPSGTGRPVES